MNSKLHYRVAKTISDIQRTLYEGESCFEHDHAEAEECQQVFLRLADKVIKQVKREVLKNKIDICTCDRNEPGRQTNPGVGMCCSCGGVDWSEM